MARTPPVPFDPHPERGRLVKQERLSVVWSETLADGERAVVKMYPCRGLWTALRGLLLPTRVERELTALAHLQEHGIPTCEPLFWARGRNRRYGFYELLATREIPGAISLADIEREGGAGRLDLEALFRQVRRMHDSGLYHGTLFMSNILAVPSSDGSLEYHFSDAPRSFVFPRSIFGTRMARYDLLDLGELVLHLPHGGDPLTAYGLDAAGREAYLRPWRTFHPKKMPRHLRRVELVLRRKLERLLVRLRPAATAPPCEPGQ